MTEEELKRYWAPARALAPHSRTLTYASAALADQLGIPYLGLGHWTEIELTPQLRTILIGLVGPHRETILKMLEAQKHEPMGT